MTSRRGDRSPVAAEGQAASAAWMQAMGSRLKWCRSDAGLAASWMLLGAADAACWDRGYTYLGLWFDSVEQTKTVTRSRVCCVEPSWSGTTGVAGSMRKVYPRFAFRKHTIKNQPRTAVPPRAGRLLDRFHLTCRSSACVTESVQFHLRLCVPGSNLRPRRHACRFSMATTPS